MPRADFGSSPFPPSLRILVAVFAIFPISLGALIALLAVQMYGIAYDIPQLAHGTKLIEWTTWVMPGLALAIGGGISIAGLFLKARWTGELVSCRKVKNCEINADGFGSENKANVGRLLASLSRSERALLRQRLAESRLAIRHDGVLVPHEQAVQMRKIEDFILL